MALVEEKERWPSLTPSPIPAGQMCPNVMSLLIGTRIIWIDTVYPEGLGWLEACCSSVAATPRLSWNLRVTPDDQALIDRAVRTSGLTRTDFVLQAARNAARELLVQQAWQAISPEQFDQFLRQLDAPPSPSDRLQRTMTAPKPWQR